MPDLYPSFDIPDNLVDENIQEEIPERIETPFFDFKEGHIRTNKIGQATIAFDQEAYIQWVYKCLLTERYEYLAYGSNFGVEIDAIIRANHPRQIAESEIKRTIREALNIDPRTVSVDNFTFEWKGDSVWVSFEIESVYSKETIGIEYRLGV